MARLLTAAQQAAYTARYWAAEAGMKELSVAGAARLRFRADGPPLRRDMGGPFRLVWDRRYKPKSDEADD